MTAHKEGFKITLWFVAASAMVVAATMIVLGTTITAFLSDRFLQREGRISRDMLESVLRAEGSADNLFDPNVDKSELESFARHILSMAGFMRANIYAPDGTVRWSSEPALVGDTERDNDELRASLAGQLITELGDLGGDTKSEHQSLIAGRDGRFIEAYIPVRDASGRIACVVEFYKSPEALDELVHDARLIVWSVAAGGALLLCATFFAIVRRGSRLIRRQQSELADMEALAMVGEMAGAVAHSLRNPLASLRSSAELAQIEHGGAVAEAMQEMMGEVDRLDQHVRDLLDYTRTQAYAVQRLDPKELIDGILAKESRRLARRGINVVVVDARPAAIPIAGDPVLLRQAIIGILSNAMEAMPDGGRLEIRIECRDNRHNVRVAFADSGRGIAAEHLGRVFDPFFTTKPRGLGLGLALTRRIVAHCMGTVAIQSVEGRGTNVILEFAAVA